MSALAEVIRAAAVEIGDQFTFDCADPNGNAHHIEWVEAKLHAHLADLAKWEAIRQTVNCPTCGAVRYIKPTPERLRRGLAGVPLIPCPDCPDGKIDMARLLAVGAALFLAVLTYDEINVNVPNRSTVFSAAELLRTLRQVRP